MAKTLATLVRTYFEGGTYRNNTVIMEIPDEAAELILKYWQERGISNCVKAKFLASNQIGNCFMRDNENDKDLAGAIWNAPRRNPGRRGIQTVI